ncbi:MAG: TerB family tellurite resistance protein [bacterium]|nr:TerB family tellurite resistance protein [bacterium]
MGFGKWISGAVGWALAGPIGGLLGYLLGSVYDMSNEQKSAKGEASGGRRVNFGAAYNDYSAQERRNSFMLSLLVLSSAVMRADGKTMRSELDYVKQFIRNNFGEYAVGDALAILKELSAKEINLNEVCGQIKFYMNSSQRLQLFHYLAGIAAADGSVAEAELSTLRTIASQLGLPNADVESILALFGQSVESAYKVLEITPDATDDEVKRAYKRMAMKYHPDRVATLGEDVRLKAEEKFKAVSAAYECIKKERGL